MSDPLIVLMVGADSQVDVRRSRFTLDVRSTDCADGRY